MATMILRSAHKVEVITSESAKAYVAANWVQRLPDCRNQCQRPDGFICTNECRLAKEQSKH